MTMTFEQAEAYIDETPKFTKKNSLSHTRDCLRRLGDPQKSFRVLHVAGTNGKGSTCAFLDSVLRQAGYRTGLFTSPHLVDICERFVIDGEKASHEAFLSAFLKVKALSDALVEEGSYHPTYFEMLFLMGMLIFAEADVQVVVLETGLGGRLDATTAIEDPLCCVITSVSLDHMQYLGNTVAEIAGEKAGIIVPGVPVVYDGNDPEAAGVIRETARRQGSPSCEVRQDQARVKSISTGGIDFFFRGWELEEQEQPWHIPFAALYQVANASLAIQTLKVVEPVLPVPQEALREGLAAASWPGRMEQVLPGVILDGAHNEDGVRRFVETAVHYQESHPLTLLFSAVNDKDYTHMIREMVENISFRRIVVTQVGGYREVPAGELEAVFRELGCREVYAVPDPKEAFHFALDQREPEGILFCVGSLYLAGIVESEVRTA